MSDSDDYDEMPPLESETVNDRHDSEEEEEENNQMEVPTETAETLYVT
jgi:hypothetical protein